MITAFESRTTKISLDQILGSDRTHQFRTTGEETESTLRDELSMLGQLHPLTLEENNDGRLIILDGFRRFDAMARLHTDETPWLEAFALVFRSEELSPLKRFALIVEKNFRGDRGFGMIDKAQCLAHFAREGLSAAELAEGAGITENELEQYFELLETPPSLQSLLNSSPIPLAYASQLIGLYAEWKRSTFAQEADQIADRILRHFRTERFSPLTWEFLIQFYWGGGKPFMSHPA